MESYRKVSPNLYIVLMSMGPQLVRKLLLTEFGCNSTALKFNSNPFNVN